MLGPVFAAIWRRLARRVAALPPSSPPTTTRSTHASLTRLVFLLAAIASATPWLSPPLALTLGILLALLSLTAFPSHSKKLSRVLIQACVIALGLRMDLRQLLAAAAEGLLFAAATILGAFALGLLLAKLLKTGRELSILLCSGTAICGGSAIAAVGTAIGASASHLAVATASIFLLNAAALYLFPLLGHALHLTDAQFGTWAGVAIHDVSSVVGAASAYHADPTSSASTALDVANVVKLSRVLWIAPIAWAAAWWTRRHQPADLQSNSASTFPWFVLWFVVASAARTFLPPLLHLDKPLVAAVAETTKSVAQLGFQVALFLIGAGLSPGAIRSVGWRAFALAFLLWIALAGASLLVVRAM